MGEGAGIRHRDVARLINNSRDRKKQSRYVVEGAKMVLEAVEQGIVLKVFASEKWWEEHGGTDKDITGMLKKCEYEVIGNTEFRELADTVTPQGILAVVKMYEKSVDEVIMQPASGGIDGGDAMESESGRRFLILENLQDPGNLGTIVRTAEAAGYKGILMNKGTVDMYNPKVVRSTMGSIFRIPFAYCDNIEYIINRCRMAGITVYGAALGGRDMRGESFPDSLAFVVGNESNGITCNTKNMCDRLVSIPMCGKVESLNASVAAAVLMYMGRPHMGLD